METKSPFAHPFPLAIVGQESTSGVIIRQEVMSDSGSAPGLKVSISHIHENYSQQSS